MKIIIIIFLFLISCSKIDENIVYCNIDAKGKLQGVNIEITIDGIIIQDSILLSFQNIYQPVSDIRIKWEHPWVYGYMEYNNQIYYAVWNKDSTYKQMQININHGKKTVSCN